MLERYTKQMARDSLPHSGGPLFPPLPPTPTSALHQPGTNGNLGLGGSDGLLPPLSHPGLAHQQQVAAQPQGQQQQGTSKPADAAASTATDNSATTTTTTTTTNGGKAATSTSKRKRKSPKKVGNKGEDG